MASSKKFVPGSEASAEKIFTYPFFVEESKKFIESHGKIMFIIRGPPGTGKNSLTDLIKDHFPTGVRCSADNYFTDTFHSPARTSESLKESHFYCHRRVKQECKKKTHPIIVSNTHMRKKEMQEYLNLACEYEYSIVIASTMDKFEVSPEILAKSNTKGLGENYFKNRLNAWQEVFPIFMGWFLCTNDSSYVLQQLQYALDILLGDGRFCRVFNAFDLDTLLSHFKTKTLLCCAAAVTKTNPFELKHYYKSEVVQESYGKCFTISIQAFIVTLSNIFAIVLLDEQQQNLILKSEEDNDLGDGGDTDMLINRMRNLLMETSYNIKLIPLSNTFSMKPKFALLSENPTEHLNLHEISFIHLAQQEDKPFSPAELNTLFKKSLTSVADQNGRIYAHQFNELESAYAVCRLSNDGWIVKLPKTLSTKTVFTGLYV